MSKYTTTASNLMEPFLRNFFDYDVNAETYGRHAMKTDIKETKDGYQVLIDLPGFKKEDIKLNYKDGYLTVEASVNSKINETEEEKWVSRERFSGSVVRTYYLGEIDDKNIHASFENGVLVIDFKKMVEEKKEHTINID